MRFIVTLLIFLSSANIYALDQFYNDELTMEDFILYQKEKGFEIYLDQPIDEVLSFFGMPKKEEVLEANIDVEDYIKYYFDDSFVGFIRFYSTVYIFETQNSQLTTKRGVSVGSSKEDLIKKYGLKAIWINEKVSEDTTKLIYHLEDNSMHVIKEDRYIKFFLVNDIVNKIAIYQ